MWFILILLSLSNDIRIFETFKKNEGYQKSFSSVVVNHLETLKLFLQQYSRTANELICEAKKKRNQITLPYSPCVTLTDDEYDFISDKKNVFCTQLSTLNDTQPYNIGDTILTKREQTCLSYILHGHTIKQISAILNISPRTVEFHFNNVKQKLKCRTKSEVITQIQKTHVQEKPEILKVRRSAD